MWHNIILYPKTNLFPNTIVILQQKKKKEGKKDNLIKLLSTFLSTFPGPQQTVPFTLSLSQTCPDPTSIHVCPLDPAATPISWTPHYPSLFWTPPLPPIPSYPMSLLYSVQTPFFLSLDPFFRRVSFLGPPWPPPQTPQRGVLEANWSGLSPGRTEHPRMNGRVTTTEAVSESGDGGSECVSRIKCFPFIYIFFFVWRRWMVYISFVIFFLSFFLNGYTSFFFFYRDLFVVRLCLGCSRGKINHRNKFKIRRPQPTIHQSIRR